MGKHKGRKGVKEKLGYLTGCEGQGRVRAVRDAQRGVTTNASRDIKEEELLYGERQQ